MLGQVTRESPRRRPVADGRPWGARDTARASFLHPDDDGRGDSRGLSSPSKLLEGQIVADLAEDTDLGSGVVDPGRLLSPVGNPTGPARGPFGAALVR